MAELTENTTASAYWFKQGVAAAKFEKSRSQVPGALSRPYGVLRRRWLDGWEAEAYRQAPKLSREFPAAKTTVPLEFPLKQKAG